ncbi:MAG: PDZ domain-containing protein [Planctomycetota bacterium]
MKAKNIFHVAILCGLVALGILVYLVRSDKQAPSGEHLRRGPAAKKNAPSHWIVASWARDEYLNDPKRINKDVQLTPIPADPPETLSDLRISRLSSESPFYMAGFRENDRVLKVNGSPVSTLSRAVNLVHEIKACNRLTVQVQRGEQVIDYQFDFE